MKPMFGYRLEVDSYSETTREPNDDGWDRGNTSTFHSFVAIKRDDTHPDLAASLEIPVGTRCFPVWVVWSTGDSFGHDEGSSKALVGVFLEYESAKELSDAIKNHSKK